MLYYGSQYYRPPFPRPDCWQRDIENMKALGFNVIKLWAVWNWIERKKGYFYFEDLDEMILLSKQNGLGVIINLIPEGAPYWTYDENVEDLYTTADGISVEYGGPANLPTAGWPGRCMDDDDFAALVDNFIEQTARHFADEEAIVSIDVWNEPHLEPMYDYRDNMLCYCKHSKNKFRSWLMQKYETIDNLNNAWYRTYTDWRQVSPPTRFGTWADMLDWRKFWLWNMSRWLELRVNACKRGAPNVLTQTHVAYSGILGNRIVGGLANELGDEFELARKVDIFGLSSFPLWLMGQEHIYRHFVHSCMTAEAAHGKPFFQVELQGGGGKPGLLGGDVPTKKDIRLWNWNTIAAGGKGSMYWQYAPEPSGIESPGFGLTGFQGENTPRSIEASKCAAKFLNTDDLRQAVSGKILNAVYVSRSSDLLCFAAGREEKLYAQSISGAFQAAYCKNIPIRFFHQDYIDELCSSGIKTLYIPMALVLNKHEVSVLTQFANGGGTVVCEACPGLYEDGGELDLSSNAIMHLFGVKHVEIQKCSETSPTNLLWISGKNAGIGSLYRQLIDKVDSAHVLATFDDGEPSVIEKKHGKGKAVWIGSFVANKFETCKDHNTQDLITTWMNPNGYEAIEHMVIKSVNSCSPPSSIIIRMLEVESKWIIVCVNTTKEKAEASIKLSRTFNIYNSQSCNDTLKLTIAAEDGDLIVLEKH